MEPRPFFHLAAQNSTLTSIPTLQMSTENDRGLQEEDSTIQPDGARMRRIQRAQRNQSKQVDSEAGQGKAPARKRESSVAPESGALEPYHLDPWYVDSLPRTIREKEVEKLSKQLGPSWIEETKNDFAEFMDSVREKRRALEKNVVEMKATHAADASARLVQACSKYSKRDDSDSGHQEPKYFYATYLGRDYGIRNDAEGPKANGRPFVKVIDLDIDLQYVSSLPVIQRGYLIMQGLACAADDEPFPKSIDFLEKLSPMTREDILELDARERRENEQYREVWSRIESLRLHS